MKQWDQFIKYDDGTEGGSDGTQQAQESGKTFTQAEVDNIIKSRLARERDTIVKDLGIEGFDKIDDFKKEYATLKGSVTELTEQNKTISEQLKSKDNDIIKYKLGIKEEKFKEALALAETKMSGTELKLEEALTKVLEEYPSLKGAKQGFGMESGDKSKAEDKPKYSREFLIAHQHIPRFKEILDNMNKK